MAAVVGLDVAQKLAGNVAFVAAVAGGIYYVYNYTEIGKVWRAALNPISTAENAVKEVGGFMETNVIKPIETSVLDPIADAVVARETQVQTLINNAQELIDTRLKPVGNAIGTDIENKVKDTGRGLEEAWNNAGNNIEQAWDNFWS